MSQMAANLLQSSSMSKLEQVLSRLRNPSSRGDALCGHGDLQPVALLMDVAVVLTLPSVLGGLRELSKEPSVIAPGKFKQFVMAGMFFPSVLSIWHF